MIHSDIFLFWSFLLVIIFNKNIDFNTPVSYNLLSKKQTWSNPATQNLRVLLGSSVANIYLRKMKTSGNKNLKIVALCSVAIFSLMALIGGAYAWFTVIMTRSLETTSFAVVNIGTCDLYSVELYKFDYSTHIYGTGEGASVVVDYSAPESGSVNKYIYNKELGQFGYYESETWHQVSVMNTFDPVDLEIHGSSLRDLHCDSIYKFTITTEDLTEATLSATVVRILDAVKQDNELFLTSCADFDLYISADLSDSNPLFSTEDDPATPEDESSEKNYYPSYIDKSVSLNEKQDVFYKLSYLSSLKNTHSHLYDSSLDEASLGAGRDVEFVYNTLLDARALEIYVNVNYAPEELESTVSLIYQRSINVICDFGFKFYFLTEDE